MSELGTVGRPLRVAVVGSGPSGFYATEALFKSDCDVRVDMFDRLPTPYGLVRLGVAPDHEKIKSVTRVYDKIASCDRFSFWGNITVGRDIGVEELRTYYDAIILACGAESDNRLNISGEDLPGSDTATRFVGWYNGHPDYRDLQFDLSHETAVIIGQGNVAVDVCRILAKTPEELAHTDIADHALEALAESKIKTVHMVGRRGPVQAKFTQLELKELGEMAACDPVVRGEDLDFDPISAAELADPANKNAPKLVKILRCFSERALSKERRLVFHFLRSPVEILGEERVTGVRLERNRIEGEPFHTKARGTGEFDELPCGLVFRSVGYRGTALPGVPFDERSGTVPNQEGRVWPGGDGAPWLYVAGWYKRGPSGVIGTNKPDSQATVACLLEDVSALTPCPVRDSARLEAELRERGIRRVSYADWRSLDAAEVESGRTKGKPREKFTRVDDMIEHLKGAESAEN